MAVVMQNLWAEEAAFQDQSSCALTAPWTCKSNMLRLYICETQPANNRSESKQPLSAFSISRQPLNNDNSFEEVSFGSIRNSSRKKCCHSSWVVC